MEITYTNGHDYAPEALEELFLSVDWESGRHPQKLAEALRNYETVIAAWDGKRLVGMLCAMDDGVMTAYVHYLLVDPRYQGKGIGRRLIELAKEKYRGYMKIVLAAYNDAVDFYISCGFKTDEGETPMYFAEL